MIPLNSLFSILNPRRGQAVISLVFTIGAIVVIAGVTLAFLALSFLNSTYGYQLSERAKAAASSGVYDALLRLDRNKDFASAGYMITVGLGAVTVSVTQDSPSAGLVTITSVSTIITRQRRMRVIVSRDATSSLTSSVSWDRT